MFKDRQYAGNKLALKLRKVIKDNDFVVVALLRGGIVLGKKVSDYFKIPLFPLSVKKIGAPFNSELAIGAVTSDKTYYLDTDLIQHLNIDEDYIKKFLGIKSKEALELQSKFPTSPRLRGASNISLKNRRIVIVDDGIATGTTAICASIFCKKQGAKEIILATPVISKDPSINVKKYFDRVISLKKVDNLGSVSQFYDFFPQVEDEEVIEILSNPSN